MSHSPNAPSPPTYNIPHPSTRIATHRHPLPPITAHYRPLQHRHSPPPRFDIHSHALCLPRTRPTYASIERYVSPCASTSPLTHGTHHHHAFTLPPASSMTHHHPLQLNTPHVPCTAPATYATQPPSRTQFNHHHVRNSTTTTPPPHAQHHHRPLTVACPFTASRAHHAHHRPSPSPPTATSTVATHLQRHTPITAHRCSLR